MKIELDKVVKNIKTVFMEITSKCNYSCKYCYNNSGTSGKIKQLTFNEISSLIQQYKQFGIKKIILSGGEPFLHPDIFKIIELIHRNDFELMIITNGSLLTKETSILLNKYKVTLQLTLDSHIEEINNYYKGKNSYKLTLNGLENLNNYFDMNNVYLRINLNYLNMNDDEILSFCHFLKERGIKNIYFAFVKCEGRASKCNYPNLYNDYDTIAGFSKRVDEISKLMKKNGINIVAPALYVANACPYSDPEKYTGTYVIYISNEGNVYPCQSLLGDEFILGNIKVSNLENIVNSINMQKFLENCAYRLKNLIGCEKCIFKNNCGKGCIADSIEYKGFLYRDKYCNIRKNEIKKTLKNMVNNYESN